MDCSWVLEHLYAYLDGELSPADAAAFQEHLNSCPACQAALQQAKAVDELLLEHTALVEPPAGLVQQVMSAIEQEPQPQGEILPFAPKRAHWGRRLGGVAVAAALLIGVTVAQPWQRQPGVTEPGLDVATLPEPEGTQPESPSQPGPETTTPEPSQQQPEADGSQQTTTQTEQQPDAAPSIRQDRPARPQQQATTAQADTTRQSDSQANASSTVTPANQPATTAETAQPADASSDTQQPEEQQNNQVEPISQPPEAEQQPFGPPTAPDYNGSNSNSSGSSGGSSGEMALPKAAYGTEGNGRFEVRLVAAHEGVDVSAPIANEKTQLVNYYIQVDGQTQLWQVDLDNTEEPSFIDAYDTISEVAPAPVTGNPSAVSPDGSLMAALGGEDQTPGLWLTALTNSTEEPKCLTETPGGAILSWAPNSGKLVFTDHLNCLYVAYPTENLVIPIATGDVSEVLWVDRGNTLLFLMCPEGSSNYGLYVAQLP